MAIYQEIYGGPGRNYSTTSARKKYIAIHNTSNNATAEAEASYAKRRTDDVSSHYYVDNNSIVQSLDTKLKAWHAGSSQGNTYAIAYEITGTNDKSENWWMENVDWDLLARQIATDMKQWNIKNKHLTIAEMQHGSGTGIVTHDDMRRAWGGTTHTDPGPKFPMTYLISKVNDYLNGDEDMPLSDEDIKKIEDAVNGHVRSAGEPALYTAVFDAQAYAKKTNATLAVMAAQLAEVAAPVDPAVIVAGVLQGLSPEAIAEAIPEEFAKQVADELAKRLEA